MKELIKLICVFTTILVLGLVGLSAFFFVAGRDIDPPDVSDVLPPPVSPIAEAENMVPILMAATNQLALTQEDSHFISNCYRRDGWDHRLWNGERGNRPLTAEESAAWADRILATNATLFAVFDEAAKRPRAQYPADLVAAFTNGWHGSEDPRFRTIGNFELASYRYGELVALRARRLRECGQVAAAVKMLLDDGEMFARLSYRLENDCLVVLFHSPVSPLADELVQAALACELPPETVRAIDAALTRWTKDFRLTFLRMNRRSVLRAKNVFPRWRHQKKNPVIAIRDGPFECVLSADSPKWLEELVRGASKVALSFPGYERYLFQPNRSIGELADIVRETEPYVCSLPYTVETRARCRVFEVAHPSDVRWCRRNGCGTADVNGHLQWMDGRNLGLHAFRTESQRVALAAACYRRQHGCYPPTLDALVPAFLVDVPRDPFDASKPLGYNAEQGTLHTVGVEGAFNGKIRDPRARYGGLMKHDCQYISRLDGRPMDIPLKSEES